MNSRILLIPAALVFSTALLASSALAQTARPATPESPYGGVTVEDIVARVNDQIITRSDYDRAMHDMDAESRQKGATMQQISEDHRDLLRNLIDQQLWLSKGKELEITGETELVNKLNEIRKQNNLETMEDLEKAAREQGISFEDFKANIRNSIITQEVMRQEVGKRIQFTPGEARRYFDEHQQDYAQPESVTLAEILVSTGTPGSDQANGQTDDPQKLAAAKAKADELEAKIHAGGDFGQLARSFSDGPTAAEGGDLGEFQRDKLAKVLEDKTFALKSGQVTEPIQTRQGYVILKVVKHTSGGVPDYKDVETQVMDNYYMVRMEPVMREYLSTMREQAYIEVKPGYTDSGASARESKLIYSAYTPPAPKKKKKVERTRFRESTRSFRQKTAQPAEPAKAASESAAGTPDAATAKKGKKAASAERAAMKPGKKEKIRFGQAPTKTLPGAPAGATEDAGAGTQVASSGQEPVNPLETQAKPTQKTRYSARPRQDKQGKQAKVSGAKTDAMAPAAPDAAEVADRQTQAGPLGLAGDTSTKKKKKSATTTEDKTRLAGKKKEKAAKESSGDVPLGPASTTPAPVPAPAPAPALQQ
jgi:peptidyl-prolyl cis-trans isomerase SurA